MAMNVRTDDFLAAAMRGEARAWPEEWRSEQDQTQFLERARYHSVTGLIMPASATWPHGIRESLRQQSLTRAAWELRHRDLLQDLLAELGRRGVQPLFLKGTALAYYVYHEPSSRSRADSDILIQPDDFDAARDAVAATGFAAPSAEAETKGALQETWRAASGGTTHTIDLHRASFNSHFLAAILPVEECFKRTVPLPGLGEGALMLAPDQFLMHVCIHRNMHRTAPYFSGGKALLGADRLIWAKDIALLAGRFDEGDWQAFVALSHDRKVARAMLEALAFAEHAAGASIPSQVRSALSKGPATERRSTYLLQSGRRSRVIANLRAGGSWRQRLGQLRSLAAPPDHSLRARYPDWSRMPRFLLLARRLFDFVASRSR